MFVIKANYFFYGGTMHAPKSGYMRNPYNDEIWYFKNRNEAVTYLEEMLNARMELIRGKQTYAQAGRYVLRHGEYAAPYYTLIKVN